MPYITNYQYYQNSGVAPLEANVGSYQYISIADIIRNFKLIYVGPDKNIDRVETHIIRFHAKQAIKLLNYDSLKQIKAFKYKVGSNLKMMMPHDYVDYVRISLCRDDILYPMVENNSIMVTKQYTQDNSGALTFDVDGNVISTEENVTGGNAITSGTNQSELECDSYTFGSKFGGNPMSSSNPLFSIRRESGVIDFGSEMENEFVVLEYISDGMNNGDDSGIMVNKFFEKYMYAYISFEILSTKRGVPVLIRQEAKQIRKAERSNAKLRMMKIHPSRLVTVLRGGPATWVK